METQGEEMLWKHQPISECFYSFFKFPETFTRQRLEENVCHFIRRQSKENNVRGYDNFSVSVEFQYKSTSSLSRMPLSDWLRYSVSILLQIVSSVFKKMTATHSRLRSVCEEDLDEVLNDQQIYAIKQLLVFSVTPFD